MKRSEFLSIERGIKVEGFRVSWELRDGNVLRSDYMPDRGEVPIQTEEEAWAWAQRVANALPLAVNIYVVRAKDFTPVKGYEDRKIRPYPFPVSELDPDTTRACVRAMAYVRDMQDSQEKEALSKILKGERLYGTDIVPPRASVL
jgi:hypothetical protein